MNAACSGRFLVKPLFEHDVPTMGELLPELDQFEGRWGKRREATAKEVLERSHVGGVGYSEYPEES
jgi:hypothetical protein